MYSSCSRLLIGLLACTVGLGALLPQRAGAAERLSFCVDATSPAAAAGKRLARAVAKAEGYEAKIKTFTGKSEGDEAFDARQFKRMANHRCDLILGFPVDEAEPSLPPGVKATKPYARTGFALVARGDLPESLDDFPNGTTVGVVRATAPNDYVIEHKNLTIDVFGYTSDVLDALASKQDDAAMVWQPSLTRYQDAHRGSRKWTSRIMNQPDAVWGLVALYAAHSEKAASIFEKGVQKLSGEGRLETLLHPDWNAQSAKADDSIAAEPKGRSGNGLFTKAQARNGHGVYAQHCAQCHGVELNGSIGPALKGPAFADKDMGYTIGPVFTFMVQMMPAGMGGSLTQKQYAQVMAFILRENGYPAGDSVLSYDKALQSKVPLIARNP